LTKKAAHGNFLPTPNALGLLLPKHREKYYKRTPKVRHETDFAPTKRDGRIEKTAASCRFLF
jgi:hypothetical protein